MGLSPNAGSAAIRNRAMNGTYGAVKEKLDDSSNPSVGSVSGELVRPAPEIVWGASQGTTATPTALRPYHLSDRGATLMPRGGEW